MKVIEIKNVSLLRFYFQSIPDDDSLSLQSTRLTFDLESVATLPQNQMTTEEKGDACKVYEKYKFNERMGEKLPISNHREEVRKFMLSFIVNTLTTTSTRKQFSIYIQFCYATQIRSTWYISYCSYCIFMNEAHR